MRHAAESQCESTRNWKQTKITWATYLCWCQSAHVPSKNRHIFQSFIRKDFCSHSNASVSFSRYFSQFYLSHQSIFDFDYGHDYSPLDPVIMLYSVSACVAQNDFNEKCVCVFFLSFPLHAQVYGFSYFGLKCFSFA